MLTTFPQAPPPELADVRLTIRGLQPQLVRWRRALHQYPELGFKEINTAHLISQQLTQWGIAHQTGVAQTGIVATIPGHRPGPVLAIRADMDALPIEEENQVAYRSQNEGIMHACGHDGHTAIALGTAYYLWIPHSCNDLARQSAYAKLHRAAWYRHSTRPYRRNSTYLPYGYGRSDD